MSSRDSPCLCIFLASHFQRKSTQVPQFLLDDPQIGPTANILITQPRRISAISVAERVASERCESAGQSVGFSVRLETSVSDCTQLLFVTPGVLMRRLNPENGEDSGRLAEFTHIIMDEVSRMIVLRVICRGKRFLT